MISQNLSPYEKAERHRKGGGVIRDLVYGAHDGLITTFAIVAGAAGASLSAPFVLIFGFANLVADAISMGLGNYLGTKSEQDFIKAERIEEEREVDEKSEEEREEVRQIYRAKGFEGELLERVVTVLTADKTRWVDTMMREELRLQDERELHPLRNGAVTFVAFIAAGFLPLIAYLVPGIDGREFAVAVLLTGAALFAVGAARVLVTGGRFLIAGLEMLLVGAVAAGAAYFIGAIVGGVVGAAI